MSKTLQELTIKNDFMFSAVMSDEANCKGLLELILGIPKCSRYFHIQMDMHLLLTGTEYTYLPKAYIIFICNFDPFGDKQYCYRYLMKCPETGRSLEDESCNIFLSTKGENKHEVSESLVRFLDYVAADLEDSTQDFNDEYIKQLQHSVAAIKSDREMGVQYMKLQLELAKKEKECKIKTGPEFILSLLNTFIGPVPDHIQELIKAETDRNS